jgi:AcrR family transcriptional regulator
MKEESTRERLLTTGLQLFGQYGFDGIRTRKIADKASVNQSAIPYYFNGKKGLYLAVAEYLTKMIKERFFSQALAAMGDIDNLSIEEAQAKLRMLIIGFVRNMMTNDNMGSRTSFLAREQLHPTQAYDILYENFLGPMHKTMSRLLGRINNRNEDDPDIILLTQAIIGQSLSFLLAKQTYLRRLGVETLENLDIETIAEKLGDMSVLLSTAIQ